MLETIRFCAWALVTPFPVIILLWVPGDVAMDICGAPRGFSLVLPTVVFALGVLGSGDLLRGSFASGVLALGGPFSGGPCSRGYSGVSCSGGPAPGVFGPGVFWAEDL